MAPIAQQKPLSRQSIDDALRAVPCLHEGKFVGPHVQKEGIRASI